MLIAKLLLKFYSEEEIIYEKCRCTIKPFKEISMKIIIPIFLFLCAIACGDITSKSGEFGRINYSLYLPYESNISDLTKVKILAGYSQEIHTQLTNKGTEEIKNPTTLIHKISPQDGVSLLPLDDSYDVPNINVVVDDGGKYTLETINEKSVFDRIKLNFAVPDSLDVIVWIRRINDENFIKVAKNGPISVDEGSQVTLVPILLDRTGDRIIGNFDAIISATPSNLVVATDNIHEIYEQKVLSNSIPVSLVFIESGLVDVTIEDTVNKMSTVLSFQIN